LRHPTNAEYIQEKNLKQLEGIELLPEAVYSKVIPAHLPPTAIALEQREQQWLSLCKPGNLYMGIAGKGGRLIRIRTQDRLRPWH
jgi:predicted component of type VI protein secretion system